MKVFFVALLALLVVETGAHASARASKKAGLYGDYNFGTKLVGANFGYNALDWLRLHIGYATPASGSRFNAQPQGGVKVLAPQWDFSPFAGIASGASSGTLALNIGLDYTASSGLNIGAGYASVSTSGASGTFIHVGYYF
jgi:hypothetical protein